MTIPTCQPYSSQCPLQPPILSFTEFKAYLKITKRDKHSLLWSSENAYTGKSRRVSGQAEVADCSIYYITGYLAQRLKKLTSCVTYFSTLYTGQLEAPVANLTACKEPLDPPQYVTAQPSASHRGVRQRSSTRAWCLRGHN